MRVASAPADLELYVPRTRLRGLFTPTVLSDTHRNMTILPCGCGVPFKLEPNSPPMSGMVPLDVAFKDPFFAHLFSLPWVGRRFSSEVSAGTFRQKANIPLGIQEPWILGSVELRLRGRALELPQSDKLSPDLGS